MTPEEFIEEIQPQFTQGKIIEITDTQGGKPERLADLAVDYPLEGFEGTLKTLEGETYTWSLLEGSEDSWKFHAVPSDRSV